MISKNHFYLLMENAKLSILKDLFGFIEYRLSPFQYQSIKLFLIIVYLLYHFFQIFQFIFLNYHFIKMFSLPTILLLLKMYFFLIFHIIQPIQSIPNASIRFHYFTIDLN